MTADVGSQTESTHINDLKTLINEQKELKVSFHAINNGPPVIHVFPIDPSCKSQGCCFKLATGSSQRYSDFCSGMLKHDWDSLTTIYRPKPIPFLRK